MTELPRKGSLPYGWQVKTSRRYPDRVYYFNIVTGSSTWECPELDPPRETAIEDKNLSSLNKNVSENEKIQLTKEFHKILPKTEENGEKCVPNDIKISKTLPDIKKENKRKCDLSDSNSVKKFLTELSRVQKNSVKSEEPGKCSVPPTAIVAPVVLEKKTCNSQNETLNKSDNKLKKENPRKRSLDEVLSDSHDNPAEVMPKKVKSPSKKIRISPLNRTNSEQKKSPGIKLQKQNKKLAVSLNCSSDTDTPETSENCSSESSSTNESNKDVVEDIEMLDVSMDIIDDLTAKKETVFDTFASYYIVVDTNVLISELSLINEIKDTPLDGCGPPHIFLPWIVIEELDRLKNQRNLKANCIRAACEAIRYLNSVLGKHPRFHGQSPAEAEQWAKTYSKCNDDKILECCVALADKMPREKVILLTNDKNLVNKALICNVIVHDSSSLMKYVKPDVVFTYSKPKDKKSKNSSSESDSSSGTSKISQSPKESPVDKNLISKRDVYKREIHSIMSTARQLLKDALAKFFYEEMEEAYGKIWRSFPIKKDLLEGILEGIKKYWDVFSGFMTAKDKRNFELLKEKASRPAGFWGDKEDCLVILSTMEEIFTQVKKRKPSINVPVSVIQDFRVACVEFFNKYCDVDKSIQSVEQESTLALFERNWAAVNQLSGVILDYCKIPHDFQYDKPDTLPSESEIRRLICNLYPSVQLLKTQMIKMLDAVLNCKPLGKIIKSLAAALLNFIPSLELPHEQVSYPNFSPAALEMFCTRPQNREMIEIGCKQIEKFYSKLDDALSSIMSSKFKKRCPSPETMICD